MEKRINLTLNIFKGLINICAPATKAKLGATKAMRMLKQKATWKLSKVTPFVITKQSDASRKICCGIFWWNFASADLKNIMRLDESYIVVGENASHHNVRCYRKRFDIIQDFKRYRLIPITRLRVVAFVAIQPAGKSHTWFCTPDFGLRLQNILKTEKNLSWTPCKSIWMSRRFYCNWSWLLHVAQGRQKNFWGRFCRVLFNFANSPELTWS